MTKGQQFAKDMRKNLGIGTRTRLRRLGLNLRESILEAVQNATYTTGYYTPAREALFREAAAAMRSYEAHIAGYRVNGDLVAHINAMSPWQFCNLLGQMIDAGVTNTGQGERFFREMGQALGTQQAA